MARTALPITAVPLNGMVDTGAGTTADQPNGHVITMPKGKTGRLFIRATQTSAGAVVLTVKAGTGAQAQAAGQGDLALSIPATTGDKLIGPLDSSRFEGPGGVINIDLAAGYVGKVWAFELAVGG